jgi:hypothetical protein
MTPISHKPAHQTRHERRAELERWRALAQLHRPTTLERIEPYFVAAVVAAALLSTLVVW